MKSTTQKKRKRTNHLKKKRNKESWDEKPTVRREGKIQKRKGEKRKIHWHRNKDIYVQREFFGIETHGKENNIRNINTNYQGRKLVNAFRYKKESS